MHLKKIINKIPQIHAENITDQIKQYDVVSFDIFDTLIKRDVPESSDVFSIVQQKFNQTENLKISGFKTDRINAEAEARKHSASEEVTVSEIYRYLRFHAESTESQNNQKIADRLLETERWAEINLCIRNSSIYPVYDYCLRSGKRIILTSDTYWERNFIAELLTLCGIEGYSALYLSSEIGKTKRSGNLFSYVLEKENVTPGKIIHIGDHKIADYLSPKRKGISAVSIARDVNHTLYLHKVIADSLDKKHIKAFINNRIDELPDDKKKIGYEVYGPLLYTFVKWLSERIDRKKTVMFFARDCYVIKPAFEILNPEIKDSVYFLGSRRSTSIPALYKNANLQTVKKLIRSESKQLTIEGLLRLLGLDAEDFTAELERFGLTSQTIIDRDRLLENQQFVNFYPCIEPKIRENAEEEHKGFIKYWESLNCSKDIQIVDIGWRGTMQFCLSNLLSEDYRLFGYYLGVKGNPHISDYEGFYLTGQDDFEKDCFIAAVMSLIEMFFSAPHGSVKKYNEDGSIEFLPYECEEDPNARQLVESLQKGALEFVRDYSASAASALFLPNNEVLFAPLRELGLHPRKQDLELFGNFPYRMGAGIVKAADPKPFFSYIKNPRAFVYDLSNSNWRVGFLRRVFKIELPYYKIFSFIYKHRM